MVRIQGVWKSYYTPGFSRVHIFRGLNLEIPLGVNVGVMGPNGAGKSTLMRLVGGIERPDKGKVLVNGRPSPPKGLSGGVIPTLTGRDNARFVCRLSGLSRDGVSEQVERIEDIAVLGRFFDRPVMTYSSGMRARLNFAINMAFEYDLYLFDELGAVGDKEFRSRASQLMSERKRNASFLIVSHSTRQLRQDCDAGLYVSQGRAEYYSDIEEAIELYEGTERRGRVKA